MDFEDVDQILKVGKGKGFLLLRRSIEALIATFQTTFLVVFSYISLSSNYSLFWNLFFFYSLSDSQI